MKHILYSVLSFILIFSSGVQCHASQGKEQLLMEAIELRNEKKAFELMKDSQINLNYQDNEKMTPLMLAAALGHLRIVEALLLKNVQLELKNEEGDTALCVAVSNEQEEIAELLIKKGAKADATCGEEEDSLLMTSIETNNAHLTALILEKAPSSKEQKNKLNKSALDLLKSSTQPAFRKLLKSQ